jgi:lipoprotein-anchoring transpeptidase ErfK/SrfK
VINLYASPSFKSDRLGRLRRDQLLNLIEEIQSADGPAHNPLWYRVVGGFVHSGNLQLINLHPPNLLIQSFPENGLLGEVTLPYVRSYRKLRTVWERLYRLYYGSIHWIAGIDEGPDGEAWYRLVNHKINIEYHAPAAAFRPVPAELLSPIGADVPPEDKWIEISIARQTLRAYQSNEIILETPISSGIPSPKNLPPEVLPTDTPTGSFRIQTKYPSRHMGDGRLTDDIYAYELMGVPWTMIFTEHGIALHGTFWHSNFGIRMSKGCVNLRNHEALWLFRWTNPVFDPSSWYKRESGTLVQISES